MRLAFVFCLTVLLAACGQAGALYLPDQPPPKHGAAKKPPAADPAPPEDANKTSQP